MVFGDRCREDIWHHKHAKDILQCLHDPPALLERFLQPANCNYHHASDRGRRHRKMTAPVRTPRLELPPVLNTSREFSSRVSVSRKYFCLERSRFGSEHLASLEQSRLQSVRPANTKLWQIARAWRLFRTAILTPAVVAAALAEGS
jgi:hypothetical protein